MKTHRCLIILLLVSFFARLWAMEKPQERKLLTQNNAFSQLPIDLLAYMASFFSLNAYGKFLRTCKAHESGSIKEAINRGQLQRMPYPSFWQEMAKKRKVLIKPLRKEQTFALRLNRLQLPFTGNELACIFSCDVHIPSSQIFDSKLSPLGMPIARCRELDLTQNGWAKPNIAALLSVFGEVKHLDLSKNQIDTLVLPQGGPCQLESFSLTNNLLAEIDTARLSQWAPGLKIMDLSSNKLKELRFPAECNFARLECLYLNKTKLAEFDLEALIQAAPLLKLLQLSGNQHIRLKFSKKYKFSKLEILYLPDTGITETDLNEIALAAPKLKTLYLYNNKLKNFQYSEGSGLTKLENLYLNNNQLTEIDLGHIAQAAPSLETLWLFDNQLQEVKLSSIWSLPNLKVLRLENNPQLPKLDIKDLKNSMTPALIALIQ